jgi:predicted transcriptional regulator of viral defense system
MTASGVGLSPAGIGQHNRRTLEILHRDAGPVFGVAEAARVLGVDRAEAARLLGYLARRGWLARVRRGLYVPVPLDSRRPGEWTEDPWVVAAHAFSPCYVGGWSACEHWGLTEQLFRTLLVVTARRVHERDVVLQGMPFQLTARPKDKMFGTVGVWRAQTRVQVSDPSRTIVDMLDEPRLGGGMRTVGEVLGEYMANEQRDDELLVSYGDRLGNRTIFKRLGYLLEHSGFDADALVAACLARRSSGLTKLDPAVEADGRIVRRWGLRVNVEVAAAAALT